MTFLGEQVPTLPNYVLTYGASTDASGDREIAVRLADQANATTETDTSDQGIVGKDTYTVPQSPALAPRLAGLYLTVVVGDQEVTRTLAEYDPARHYDQPVTQATSCVTSPGQSPLGSSTSGSLTPSTTSWGGGRIESDRLPGFTR